VTDRHNGKDIGTGHVQPIPAPALDFEDRVMCLLWIKAVIDGDHELRSVVHTLNEDSLTVPVPFVDALITYMVRLCPFLRSDATRQNIKTERQTVRENWRLADTHDWKRGDR